MPRSVASTSTAHASNTGRNTRSKKKAPVISQEVIEISSDEDDDIPVRRFSVAPTPGPQPAALRRDNRRLREERDSLKRELETLHTQLEYSRHKVRDLEIQSGVSAGKVALNDSELDDIVSCNICSHTMFTPYILTVCGHTFCQKCLKDWFDHTLRNFIPNHNQPQIAPNLMAMLQAPGMLQHPQMAAYIQAHIPLQPQYTCPECRAPVKAAPVENFAMKSLARMVTSAKKDAVPPTPARPRVGPWERYFPSR